MTHGFADLTSDQVAALRIDDRTPVLLLPVGAIEPHGPHAPLATDMILAEAHCHRTARALADDPDVRALVLPPLNYGVTRYASDFPGAVSVSESTLRALVIDVCRSLAADGLQRIAIVNHHFEPEHVAVLRGTVDSLQADGVQVALLDLTRRRNAARLTDEFQRGSCHAGRYETSMVLAQRPELVLADVAKTLPAFEVDMPAAMQAGQTDFVAMGMEHAYCGAPAEATAAEGDATYAVLVEMLTELVRELAQGD